MNDKQIAKFQSNVKHGSVNECWPWTGARTPRGYGQTSLGGHSQGAHRVAWMLANKQNIPLKMCIMHKCDNPKCCNPNHLLLGTPKENMMDMTRKGRGAKADAVSNAGLQLAIDKAGGKAALARLLNIKVQAISQWSDVPVKRILAIEAATGVPRRKLRPDLYGPREML